jgi:hypothetical protein
MATKFVAAQERATAGDKESIAHAVTWCRRMYKSLADRRDISLLPTDEKPPPPT